MTIKNIHIIINISLRWSEIQNTIISYKYTAPLGLNTIYQCRYLIQNFVFIHNSQFTIHNS